MKIGVMPSMMKIMGMGCLIALGMGSAGVSHAQSLASDEDLRGIGLTEYWSAQLPLGAGDAVRGAYVVDDLIYATTEMGTVFALQAEMGLIRWAEPVASPHEQIHPPRHVLTANGDGPVIVTTTTAIRLLDRYTGETLTTLRTGMTPSSTVIGVGHHLYFSTAEGRFYSVLWSEQAAGKWRRAWEVIIGGAVQAVPVFYGDDRIIFGNLNGLVVSFFAADKTLDWNYKTGDAITADPVVDAGGAYVASLDRSLYKFDAETGEVLWRFRAERPLQDGPVLRAHTVYQFCAGTGLLAIDAHTGKEMWRQADGRAFVAADRHRDILWTSNDGLVVVDHESGKRLGSAPTNGPCLALSHTGGDAVLLVGLDGRILSARSSSGPYLRRREVNTTADRLTIRPHPAEQEPVAPPPERAPDPLDEDPLRSRRDTRP